MKVFIFDLLAYGENLDHVKVGAEMPYPLSKRHFKADVAVRTYAEHLDAWEEMDRLGYDGIGFNEHHCSPYGLMNSPNLMAASAAQRTKRLKLLIYGNLLPLHEPLRLAEELAMLDCLSNGRLISGFARGIPREYQVHNVPLSESRARFEEAFDIVTRAWTEDVFSYQGRFWSYKDVAIWPRPVQRPYPPIMIPIVGSQESIEVAGKHDIAITPGLAGGGLRDDIVRHYAKSGAAAGGLCQPELDGLCAAAQPARRRAAARGLPQHDDGRYRAHGREHALGHAPGSGRANHCPGRGRWRQHGADRLQSRRDAPGYVPEPDSPFWSRRAADPAGARDHARAGRGRDRGSLSLDGAQAGHENQPGSGGVSIVSHSTRSSAKAWPLGANGAGSSKAPTWMWISVGQRAPS